MALFHRRGGAYVATFPATDAQVVRHIVGEVRDLLRDGGDRADPAVERLFPDVYPDDEAAAAEFRRYTADELTAGKLDQAQRVLDMLPADGGQVRLDEPAAEAWLRALTDVRLVLGTRLGVADDTDLAEELDDAVARDPTSARVALLSVYGYLTYLQDSLVDALSG